MMLSRRWSLVLVAAVFAHGGVRASSPPPDACRLARQAAADASLRVPFELVDGRVYVHARVNGEGPYRFAVDTGASGMGRADARLVAALALPVSGQQANSDGIRTAQADTVKFASLELGGVARHDLEVITRDYNAGKPLAQHFDGILGRGFFADGLLVIDYPRRTLAFTTDAALPADATGSLAYERAFRVPVSLAGIDTTAQLDTGANVTAVLPRALYDRIPASALQAAGRGGLANGSIETSRATVAGPLVMGGVRVTDVEVRVADGFPELLVGAHLLQRHLLAIDQRSRRVALCGAVAD